MPICADQDAVKTHDLNNENQLMSLTPPDDQKRKENAGPHDASPDAKRRDTKTESFSEVYKGKEMWSDDEEELSGISDEEGDTLETILFHGRETKYMQRNGDLVEFSYMTKCGDFTALKKALEKVADPGTPSYKKRFRLIKKLQLQFEEVAKVHHRFCGVVGVEVDWTKKGHLGVANVLIPSWEEVKDIFVGEKESVV